MAATHPPDKLIVQPAAPDPTHLLFDNFCSNDSVLFDSDSGLLATRAGFAGGTARVQQGCIDDAARDAADLFVPKRAKSCQRELSLAKES